MQHLEGISRLLRTCYICEGVQVHATEALRFLNGELREMGDLLEIVVCLFSINFVWSMLGPVSWAALENLEHHSWLGSSGNPGES